MIISRVLRLTDRIKEIIVRSGENIAYVKVLGVPNNFWGEFVCACLKIKSTDFDEKKLRISLATRLANYKIPEHFLVYDKFWIIMEKWTQKRKYSSGHKRSNYMQAKKYDEDFKKSIVALYENGKTQSIAKQNTIRKNSAYLLKSKKFITHITASTVTEK